MSNLWLTSDLHFGHSNIIKYCNRPFKDVDEMDRVIIRKWNERVKSTDTVIHNGDFCFKNSSNGKEGEGRIYKAEYYLSKLNGRITFVGGNHDHNNSLRTKIKSLVLDYGGEEYFVIHDPEYADSSFKINLVGHIHEKWKITRKYDNVYDSTICYNVGVDVHSFYPISMQEIIRDIAKWRKDNEKEK